MQDTAADRKRMSSSRMIRWPLVLGLIFLVAACSTTEDDAVSEASSTSTSAASSSEPLAPDGMMDLIESYLASWEAKDEQALRASVADNFIVNEYIYSL